MKIKITPKAQWPFLGLLGHTGNMKMLLILTLMFGVCEQVRAQDRNINPNKNPVRSMVLQRYFHLSSLYLGMRYKWSNHLLNKYITYQSPREKKGWELTFEDNFDSIDRNKWRLGQPWGYYHDASLHQYHDEHMVQSENGCLILKGEYKPKSFRHRDSDLVIPYAIGLINSDISFMQKYGYFEVRCKNPAGPATWPAFWLTGAHKWPPEIDIFEMYGKSTGHRIHQQIASIHFGVNETRSRATLVRKIQLTRDTDSLFHVYACEWTSKRIRFYTDGILVRQQRIHKRLRPFMDDEMVIILNNGFEAKYLKYLPEPFKGNRFVVDYIRVYKTNPVSK